MNEKLDNTSTISDKWRLTEDKDIKLHKTLNKH